MKAFCTTEPEVNHVTSYLLGFSTSPRWKNSYMNIIIYSLVVALAIRRLPGGNKRLKRKESLTKGGQDKSAYKIYKSSMFSPLFCDADFPIFLVQSVLQHTLFHLSPWFN